MPEQRRPVRPTAAEEEWRVESTSHRSGVRQRDAAGSERRVTSRSDESAATLTVEELAGASVGSIALFLLFVALVVLRLKKPKFFKQIFGWYVHKNSLLPVRDKIWVINTIVTVPVSFYERKTGIFTYLSSIGWNFKKSYLNNRNNLMNHW